MDDYRSFRGRATLEALRARRDGADGGLSPEDETVLMILKLAGLELDELIKKGQSDIGGIHERQMDVEDAARTLTASVEGRWGQNVYRVQFRVDGQSFFTEIEETDKEIGMIPLEEQSKGFQWFFSFDLHFMHDSKGTFEGCVLLLDEPGLHLHPGGQADLLRRLDAYAKSNTLVYTTHLPFLVDLRDPKRVKVIRQTQEGAEVANDLGASQAEEKLTLQAALGMRANQSYLVANRNLLVEGVHDFWLITELSRIFEREDRACLADDVMITAARSASEIVPMAAFMIGQELEVVALFDSDTAGEEAEKKLREEWITCYKEARARTVLIGDALGIEGAVTIEDLFPNDYYLDKTRESHASKFQSAGRSVDALEIEGMGPILPRLSRRCEAMGVQFNKGSVAKVIRRELMKCSGIRELPAGLAERAAMLLNALDEAFGGGGEGGA